MNKSNRSLGKRSTNILALSTKVSNIKQSINPSITVRSLSTNPKALKTAKEQFQTRTVRLFKGVSAVGGASADITYGDVVTALGITSASEALRLRVLSVKAWNMSFSNAGSSNYIKFTTGGSVLDTGAVTSVDDIGTGTSLPGIHVIFPRTLSKTVESISAQSVTIGSVEVNPLTTGGAGTCNVCLDIGVEYKYSATA